MTNPAGTLSSSVASGGESDRVSAALRGPIFIVGAPRSGTTWLQRMLLDHPSVCGGQESHFFRAFSMVLAWCYEEKSESRNVGLTWYWEREELLERVRGLFRETFGPVVERKASATVLLEKTPDHALDVLTIRRFLPGARFVHLIRDSRAVVASLLAASREGWGSRWAPGDVRVAAKRWRRYVRRAGRASGGAPGSYYELHYEDLRESPVEELGRLMGFIGLECEEPVLRQIVESNTIERQKKSAAAFSGGDGAYQEPKGFFRSGGVDTWKRELSFLQRWIVWRETGRVMRECGYDRGGRRRG